MWPIVWIERTSKCSKIAMAGVIRALQSNDDHEYWTRLWIEQEVILSTKIHVHVGAYLSWAQLFHLIKRAAA